MTSENEISHGAHSKQEDIALFRYGIVIQACNESLTKAQRGAIVRRLASQSHKTPDGKMISVSRPTIDRWIRMYRKGGFKALYPNEHHLEPRTPNEVLKLTETLRMEDPYRTAAHICQILKTTNGWSPSARTIQC